MEPSVNEIVFYLVHPATVIIYTRTDLLLYPVSCKKTMEQSAKDLLQKRTCFCKDGAI